MFLPNILISTVLTGGLPIPITDGYTNTLSAFPSDSIELYLNARTELPQYEVKLFNLQHQEVAQFTLDVIPQMATPGDSYETGFNYKTTGKIKVPALKSGVYLWEDKIPFIIKSKQAKIVVLYPSNTENAYCDAGGRSLYGFNSMNNVAAKKVSFLRPIPLPKHAEAFLRWMQTQPFQDVGYITDMDLDDYNSIKRSSILIIPGHSEYWTLQARKNFDRFVEEGNDAVVLSGNTMWWQVRYNSERNQVICYRKGEDDPIRSLKLKTILWNDASLNYPILQSLGTDFSLAGYGLKEDKGWNGYKIIAKSPLLENTTLQQNQILSLPSEELDGAPIAGFTNGIPTLDRQALGFYKIEIVGFDMVSRLGKDGVATWIVFKPTKTSGILINTASTNWCANNGIGTNSDIQKITFNMISKLVGKENVFSPDSDDKSLSILKPVLN